MMTTAPLHDAWTLRIDDVWRRAPELAGSQLVAEIDALATERPATDARALFERACARDSAGQEADAEPLYRAALQTGQLDPYRQTRAVIQLASTLRWLDRLDDSEALLIEELERHQRPGHDAPLHDEARALLALTYAAQGRGREAAGLALATLAPHLSRYNRSTLTAARQLVAEVWEREPVMAGPAPVELTEGRFLLRPYRPSDLAAFVAGVLESHQTIGRWMKWAHAGFSTADGAEWLAHCARGWQSGTCYEFGIFDRETGDFIGGAGLNSLHPVHPFCNLGYWVRDSRHRQGAASAAVRALSRHAFDALKLARVEIVVAQGNEASLAVARRSGARHEGVLRNRIRGVEGRAEDAHMFSLAPGAT
ncbi:Protein N-acetyltransferase, RimJ/RimL family [Roseateles sp. YR242]|uniref:tetratricopeptide repeat protein n=1 Tax=Roseateles sp. YR242 TaxID=1855305 RepID=UPI0008D75168|nr:tetratricopeptide repeat protein [Roseateles sp. YR242]SEK55770.1 Protein N-acetyltransferase, RimJ/RimL family [Roseateles sp. YR242]